MDRQTTDTEAELIAPEDYPQMVEQAGRPAPCKPCNRTVSR